MARVDRTSDHPVHARECYDRRAWNQAFVSFVQADQACLSRRVSCPASATADPAWLPLLWTPPGQPLQFLIPPIPDYPSAAAIASAAAAAVLTVHLGDSVPFAVTSVTLPGVTRRFSSFAHAAHEAGMSRVYGGIHFVHAVEDGWAEGKKVGRSVSRSLPRSR
jgi:hypothetical protein